MAIHLTAGQMVDHHYEVVFIVLASLSSVIGCWTTLELLQRRTSIHGLYNWYLLFAASLMMSSVGIWSMHRLGTDAIIMADGEEDFQLNYSGRFSAGALLMPIFLVGGAFYVFSISEKVSISRTLTGGFLVGFSICGMHYLDQHGIANYTTVYTPGTVVGAALIAITTSTFALWLFFYLNSKWTNNWIKRVCCACILATAVSGMFWVATIGTSYRYNNGPKVGPHTVRRRSSAIIVFSLSLASCVVLMTLAILGQRSKRQSATRAQEVILASATFDMEGRIMVNPEGLLPCEKITNSYLERTFDETFDIGHPVFCWLYRLSHCWPAIYEFLPGMYNTVRRTTRPNTANQSTRPGTATSTEFGPNRYSGGSDDYETLFKQLFCVAANNLAAMLHDNLGNMGVLFGDICNTGTLDKSNAAKRLAKRIGNFFRRRNLSKTSRAEQGIALHRTSGSGQLMFLVRRMGKTEAGKLRAIGYKFAHIGHVADSLARSLEITTRELLPRLEQMRKIAGTEMLFEAGVHLACFAVRPIFRKGFDVLVRKDAKNLLPTVRLPIEKLSVAQFNLLKRFDGLTVVACLAKLRHWSTPANHEEDVFCRMFFDALTQLKIHLKDPFFDEATLTARALVAPCSQISSSQRLEYASIIAFRIITDVHGIGNVDKRFQYIPCPFFLTQQKVYKGYSDIERFAQEVRDGFGRRLRRADSAFESIFRPGQSVNEERPSNRRNRYLLKARLAPTRKFPFVTRVGRPVIDDYSSIRGLMNLNTSGLFGNGGSLDEVHGGNNPDIEMITFSDSRQPVPERRNYAEELVLILVQERTRPRQNRRSRF